MTLNDLERRNSPYFAFEHLVLPVTEDRMVVFFHSSAGQNTGM